MWKEIALRELEELCEKRCDDGKCPSFRSSYSSYCESEVDDDNCICELAFAIYSAKKQIPKKPDYLKKYWGNARNIEKCPVCGHFPALEKYCPKCGQMINIGGTL